MMAERLILVGASAGGFDALQQLLPAFPAVAGLAVVVVLHLHPQSLLGPAEFFSWLRGLKCREAQDKEAILDKTVYFAPPAYHLLIERNRTFSLSVDDPVQWARPSIDVLFESAAQAYGQNCVAIILTGANQDGAYGCARLAERGATVYVQDPEEAAVSSMPRAALARCPQAKSLSLCEMGSRVQHWEKTRES